MSGYRLRTSACSRDALAEANPAFYVDFEGRTEEAPVVLGVLRSLGRLDTFVQQVLDK